VKSTLGGQLVIDGRELTVTSFAKDQEDFAFVRMWDKTERKDLPQDIRHVFVKACTGFVLNKNNKLSAPKVTADNAKFLVQVQNLQTQLKSLKAHMISYDIYDVMTIVVPTDVRHTAAIENNTFNVFDDHTRLHPMHVANSNTWFHRWVNNAYIQENMALTLRLLESNTDENLWSKCLEAYEEYHPIQQGGPLMAYLILQHIQDSSDMALEHLRAQIVSLDIGKLPGENVDQAVSLIKSTYRVLKCSSTQARSYVPVEFPKVVMEVFTTCTVPEFTEPFHTMITKLQTVADMEGTRPQWPSVSKILNMATNSYHRLKSSGRWDKSARAKSSAYVTQATWRSPRSETRPSGKCFNCGSADHMLYDCPKPRDERKIEGNRKKFFDDKKKRQSSSPRGSNSGGSREGSLPMKLNKHGLLVVDQKKYQQMRRAATSSSTAPTPVANPSTPSIQANMASTNPEMVSSSDRPSPSTTQAQSDVAPRARAIRSALRRTA
jgi:hypothetical protein